jgi:hypothetical protein
MKTLMILSLAIISLNAFSAEVGEDKKSDCAFANQSKREKKEVDDKVAAEETKGKEVKTLSK